MISSWDSACIDLVVNRVRLPPVRRATFIHARLKSTDNRVRLERDGVLFGFLWYHYFFISFTSINNFERDETMLELYERKLYKAFVIVIPEL